MDPLRVAAKVVHRHWDIFARWLIGLVGIYVGVRTLAGEHGVWKDITLMTGIFFLGWGLTKFVREWRAIVQAPVTRPIWGYTPTYGSWEPLGLGRTHAIYSRELNKRLAAEDPIRLERGSAWFPRGRAGELRERACVRLGRNDAKLRLASDLLDSSASVVLDETDYASFIATNRLAYVAWWHRDKDEMYLTFEDLEPSALVARTLPDLKESRASNHLGGDILAVGDRCFFLQLQNAKNGMYPDQWVASGSGSFDTQDWPSSDILQDLVKTGLLRELREEMRLRPEDVPRMSDTKVIGFSRATYMGGKPQFYGVTRIGNVKPRTDRYGQRFARVPFSDGADGLIEALNAFLKKHHDQISPPLEMLGMVVENWLEEPQAADWLLRPR